MLEVLPDQLIKKRNKRHQNWEGRSKIISVHTWHDPVRRNTQRIYREAAGANERPRQSFKIQDQQKIDWRLPEARGRENGELLLNWYKVSVWGDRNVFEMDGGDGYATS